MKKTPIKNTYRPQLQSVLQREKVYEEIEQLSQLCPIIWLEGVAGSGKTTLINSYLEKKKAPCLWYSLDETDNDIAVFFNRISQFINKKMKVSDKTISLLSLPFRPEYKSVAKFFFQEIQNHVGDSFSLVLDDYHVIENKDFHEMLVEALLCLNQGNMRVYIISRMRPAPVYSRLKAKRLLANIEKKSLQFSQSEIFQLVELLSGKQISEDKLDLLLQNTQGWVSGVILLLDLITDEDFSLAEKHDLDMGVLFDYFATELFEALDPSMQSILLKSALLNEIDTEKDKYLFNNLDINTILQTLYQRNYFTYRSKNNAKVYRYHPLFKEFLKEKANLYFSDSELRELKKAIANKFHQCGDIEGEVPLRLAVEQWSIVVNIIESNAAKLIAKGQASLLLQWINQLPEATVVKNPWVFYWKANCILAYDQLSAYDAFVLVHKAFEKQNDINGQFYAICGILESVLFSFNNYHRINTWTKVVSELYRVGIKPKGIEISARLSADMHTALLFCEPSHPDLAKWEKNVGYLMKLLKFSFSADHIVLVGVNLFYQYLWAGDRNKAFKTLDMTRPSSSNESMNPVSQGAWYLMASVNAWLDGNAENGLHYADKGLAVAAKTGVTFWADILLLQKAYSYSRLGKYSQAREVLREYQNHSHQHSEISDSVFYDVSSQLDYYTGDLDSALQNCQICVEKSKKIGLLYSDVGFRVSLAELSMANDEFSAARKIIDKAKKECIDWRCDLYLYRCYLVETRLNLKLNQLSEAKTSMGNAMQLARERGFTNHSWWHPEHITPLYEFCLKHDIETDYVVHCIVHNQLNVRIPLIEYENWPWKVKINTLGEFSIRVDNKDISTVGKSMRKPVSLLKALLSLGPWRVNQIQLSELLWPDAEADEALQALNTTIYRLRKILSSQTIWVKDGNVGLNKDLVWIDVERVKYYLAKSNALQQTTKFYHESQGIIEKLVSCYHGRFLEKEIEEPWIYRFAQELENRILNLLYAYAKVAEANDDKDGALQILNHARTLNILNETTYRKNIALLLDLGRHAEAKLLFKECKTLLSRVLGTQPSKEICQLIR